MGREDHDRMGTADLVARSEDRQPVPPVQQQEAMRQHQQEMQREQQARPGMPDQRADMERPPAQGGMPRQADDALHQQPAMHQQPMQPGAEQQLAALFPPEVAAQFRQRWDNVQIGFVDDPREAVRHADELVAEVMKHLAASFADQRARLEAGLGHGEQGNTEQLRMALRGYRSFFQRLLSL